MLDKKNIKCLVRKDSKVDHLKGIELVYGDITDSTSLDSSLKDVTEVIHLAASTHDQSLFHIVNVNGTKNLLEACKKNKVKDLFLLVLWLQPEGSWMIMVRVRKRLKS